MRPRAPGPRFAGGLVGAIGYEAGAELERMPAPRASGPLPPLLLRRYEGALHLEEGQLIAAGSPAFLEEAARSLAAVRPAPAPRASLVEVLDSGDPEGFEAGVRRLLEHIAAGDCYQANLARRVVLGGLDHPLEAYRRLRERPAEWGAYLELEQGALLSNSPELFLRKRGARVQSRPIKGTRPLGQERVDYTADLLSLICF